MIRSLRVSVPVAAGFTALSQGNIKSFSQARKSSRVAPMSLKNKVVLVTGATAGIGASCAWQFAEEGCKLILVGRRDDRLQSVKKDILSNYPNIDVHTVSMSVSDLKAVAELPNKLPAKFKDVEIIVNNAGLALGVTPADENDMEAAQTVMDTNVLGTIAMCRAFLPGMKQRGSGHIINMGSVAGHYAYINGSTYNASKYAVRGFTEAARHDLAGTPIRVTHISPGMVGGTEFSNVRLGDDSKASAVYDNIVALNPDDVADNVLYAATRPAHVQIADIIMYCTNQSGPREVVRLGPSLGAPQKK
eukprot:CAMPEP_0170395320 /NCGR_PEP_ID=MMETSP0117_2-20130122/21715_1 /TAXON_ID=400756 /ORGANISM="Durinskia baltica, Strain CSIRO CS-38" /LENGTH=303 /DNA_ID=CAMNT_0010651621 /DNA_START=22 /DNA_END=933 /DNA_ORIENTATION=+